MISGLAVGNAVERDGNFNDKLCSHETPRIAWAKLMARVGGSFQCSALRCGGDIRPSAFKPFTSAKPSLAFALLATSDRCRLPVRVPGSIWNGPIILAVAQPPAQARGVCPPPARPRSAACSGISRCPGSRHASPPAPTDRSGKECYFHRAERPDRSFFQQKSGIPWNHSPLCCDFQLPQTPRGTRFADV